MPNNGNAGFQPGSLQTFIEIKIYLTLLAVRDQSSYSHSRDVWSIRLEEIAEWLGLKTLQGFGFKVSDHKVVRSSGRTQAFR
jgi:hypothetical protein